MIRALRTIFAKPNPARELARIGHEKRRAHIRATAQQMRLEMGLPPDLRLKG